MFAPYVRDPAARQRELHEFERLLQAGTALGERADILPFFRQNRHLAACLGYANNNLASPDLLGVEQELLGFRCDIAIGDSRRSQFTLAELEDASEKSIFRPRTLTRAFPHWSNRFEAGFSQLVDWAWRIGRDRWLDAAGSARLDWPYRNNGIQGQLMTVWTYDYFLGFVQARINEAMADSASAHR